MAARRDRLQGRRSIADKWNLHCGQLELPENHESDQHDLTKNRIAVVLLGSIAPQTFLLNSGEELNLGRCKLDISVGSYFDPRMHWRT